MSDQRLSGLMSGPVIWSAVCRPVPVSGPVFWSSVSVICIWLSGLVLLSGQVIALQMPGPGKVIALLSNLIRWVFDNIGVRKLITTFKCYTI